MSTDKLTDMSSKTLDQYHIETFRNVQVSIRFWRLEFEAHHFEFC